MSEDPPETVGDLDDPGRELWVVPNTFGQERCVHLTDECRGVDDSDRLRPTTARQEHIDSPVCRYCSGAYEPNGKTGEKLHSKIKGAWADDD